MAYTGNHNNQGDPPFDLNALFKPTNMAAPNPSNPGFPPSYAPPTPSASYPPPSYSYAPQNPLFYHNPSPPVHPNLAAPPLNPNPGASLMALISPPPNNFEYHNSPLLPPVQPSSSGSSEFLVPFPYSVQPQHAITAADSEPPLRLASRKVPRGRHLVGDVVYDVDVRLQGEVQPQLEVSPITKYMSDPELILGSQVAVNNSYICYGLKQGNFRVLNISTASRTLVRAHTQRITDMAFFAEDVHLLASASIDGRVYVGKISEGADGGGKQQISVNALVAVHIAGEKGSIHPRLCWHCFKQEVLVLAVSHHVLRIDTTKVGKDEAFTVEAPLQCSLDKLVNGIQLVGKHDAEVTDLSMCQWMTTTRLVSASKDGTIKIWEDHKSQPLLVLKPHDGHPVNAAIFLTAPDRPHHIILLTAGPQNRELKLWTSSREEGWFLPSDDESWQCLQTLELKSSAEQRVEDAFFNQVIGLPQTGLILLANARKTAIYAVHLEYGANPAATRMDYLAEFTVTMPILSFTGTSGVSPHGEHVVKVYCVQTQAIQQYALDLSQCLPPPVENFGREKSDFDVTEGIPVLEPSGGKAFDVESGISGPIPSNVAGFPASSSEIKRALSFASDSGISKENPTLRLDSDKIASLPVTNHADVSVASPSIPQSPVLLQKPSDLRVDLAFTDYSVDEQIDNSKMNLHSLLSTDGDSKIAQAEVKPSVTFKHPHLITPSEIIMATSSSDTTLLAESKSEAEPEIQEVVVTSDVRNMDLELKVVDEARFVQESNFSTQVDSQIRTNRKENFFCSQASELGADMSRESCTLPTEASILEEAQNSIMDALAQPSNSGKEADKTMDYATTRNSADFGASASAPSASAQVSKSRKQKGKFFQATGMTSSSQIAYNSANTLNDTAAATTFLTAETALQLASMSKMIEQLVTAVTEMQKQMPMVVDVPLAKESRRLEVALGRSFEKAGKANADALTARMQEECAKLDKLIRERTQQMTSLVTNCFNKDLMPVLDKLMKKEMAVVSTNVARSVVPVIEKTISSAISESFQKGVGDKAVNQIEKVFNSRVEAIISRQIQVQFQTSGKQALQEGLKSILEASIVPAFEMSCKAMFGQVDATFRQGMAEHMTAAQYQIESAHSPLAMSLRETINSASSITQSLSVELAEQRKLVAFAAAGANSKALLPLSQLTNGPSVLHKKDEEPYNPTKELSRLISEHKYEEAFTAALQRSDVPIVSWLCSQVDLQRLLSINPLPLSQRVMLSLLQQLACDITNDTSRKLQLMTDVAAAINPGDPMIAIHARSIFEQVYQILNHHRSQTTSSPELASIRVIMHVINSMLMTCK